MNDGFIWALITGPPALWVLALAVKDIFTDDDGYDWTADNGDSESECLNRDDYA